MIPNYQALMRPVLEVLADGQTRSMAQLRRDVAAGLELSAEEAAQMPPTGRQTTVDNRIGWAVSYLAHAGMVERPRRGYVFITTAGREALAEGVTIDVTYLNQFPEFQQWRTNGANANAEELGDTSQVWLVGATIFGEDLSATFIAGGYWHIDAPTAKHRALLAQMQVGDRIAIKASFSQKHDLPFEGHGNTASAMRIKARGTITEAYDGERLGVAWEALEPPRTWYFYTYLGTIWQLPAEPAALQLERFIFDDEPQNFSYFTNHPFWRDRFGTHGAPSPADEESHASEAHSEVDESVADDETVDEDDSAAPYDIDALLAEGCFVPRAELERIIAALHQNKNVILQGAPGTGKTWLARRLGWVLAGRQHAAEVQVVQFHPNTSYEDFVRGYRPVAGREGGGSLELVDGPFLRLAHAAHEAASVNHTMVIEELNRGNPARSLGEMLTLLEASKRNPDDAIRLLYERPGEEGTWLPGNLHVIGTMNIADRSLAQLDLALRRRFAFFTLVPQFGDAWRQWMEQFVPDAAIVQRIGERATAVNQQISNDPTLGSHFAIGHSFFTPASGEPLEDPWGWFRGQVTSSVAPLLREYWFDAPEAAEAAIDILLSRD